MKNNETYLKTIYDYLIENHLGAEKSCTREELATELNINKRQLRRITSEINKSTDFEKLISTKNKTYICNTKDECIGAISNTFKLAITQFKKARAMQKKLGLQGQIKIQLNQDEMQEIIEVYGK